MFSWVTGHRISLYGELGYKWDIYITSPVPTAQERGGKTKGDGHKTVFYAGQAGALKLTASVVVCT